MAWVRRSVVVFLPRVGLLRRQRCAWTVGVAVVAAMVSLIVYRQLWVDPMQRTLGSAGRMNDPIQTMWDLSWVANQVLHGHNPFVTDAIYYPGGVSLSWNTLTSSLGIAAAPLTLTAGPVFTYAVLITLAPALASVTGFFWLRRHTRRQLAAAVGGLVIGFNPFMSGHMLGHLDLTFTCLVPVMLMLSEDLLWRRPRPDRRTAVYLGLVAAVQAGINEELILITAVGVAVAVAAALVGARHAVFAALGAAAPEFGIAVGVFVLAASPLLVSQFVLSHSVRLHSSGWSAHVTDYLLPLGRQLFDPGVPHASRLGAAEDGVYLGPVLVAVLVVGVLVRWAHDRMVRIAAVTLTAMVVLTFGASGPGGIPLPWGLVGDLPGFTSVLPGRFAFVSFLVIAWLTSRWIDQLLERAHGRAWHRLLTGRLALATMVASLVLLTPASVGAAGLPPRVAFFSSAAFRSLVPSGSPVLLLPLATPFDASGMYYQMQSDFRFDQPGGYALRPNGAGAAAGPPPSPLVQLCTQTAATTAGVDLAQAEILAARRQLESEHYRAIIVINSAQRPRLVRLAQLLAPRTAPWVTGGVTIWLLTGKQASTLG